jgi:transposase
MQQLSLGIDWGTQFSQVFGLGDGGEIVLEERVRTLDELAWRALLERLRTRGYSIHAGFEIGAQYDWLYDLLKEYCAEVSVIEPSHFAIIGKSQRKTDKIDACKIAEGIRRGDLPTVFVPPKQTRADRRLVAFVHWHSQQSSRVKGKLRSLLLMYRLECPYSNVGGSKARAWLNEQSVKMDAVGQLVLTDLLAQLDLLVSQRKNLDARVKERAKSYEQAELLDSVPGLGALGILAVLSSIAGIGRFERPDRLASYFGVCGSVHQSGQSLRNGPLTKRGNVHVRWLLSQALQHLHKKDARAKKRYDKLRRKKPRGVARAAQVRWLANVLWFVLTRNEAYRCKAA